MELQTDRLQLESGAHTIESLVHFHDRDIQQRLVTLISIKEGGHREPQSIAFTRLTTQFWNAPILAVDKTLEAHKLMGQTFRQAGYNVHQNRLLRIRFPLLNRSLARYYNCSLWTSAEIECYEFWANDKLYGVVLEIKNPSRREAPQRPKNGYYAFRQTAKLGVCEPLALLCARLIGVAVSTQLYFRCLARIRRFI